MKIRRFRAKDAERCIEIIYECIEISKKTTKKDKEHLRRIYTSEKIIELARKSDFFVVEENKKVIGSGRLEKSKIATLYFDPKFHRKGNGTKMIKKLEELARTRKIKRVYLDALLQAIGFYEKQGFRKKKRLYKPINSMRMEKRL